MSTTLNPASEADRVRRFTSSATLHKIEEKIERNVAYYASQPDDVIAQRIEELKREWSVNRLIQAHAATVGLVGAVLGFTVNRKWALLTLGAFGSLFVHGIRGWAPPLPLLRQLGMRTRTEIDREIYALKVARGDFKDLPLERMKDSSVAASEILQAINA
jgi:hypothetical protein